MTQKNAAAYNNNLLRGNDRRFFQDFWYEKRNNE